MFGQTQGNAGQRLSQLGREVVVGWGGYSLITFVVPSFDVMSFHDTRLLLVSTNNFKSSLEIIRPARRWVPAIKSGWCAYEDNMEALLTQKTPAVCRHLPNTLRLRFRNGRNVRVGRLH